MTDLETILSWFQTGDLPTQEEFQETFSSFRLKNTKIPIAEVDGLESSLNNKVNVGDIIGGGGDFIPLTGTESGKPVTGDIEIEGGAINLGINTGISTINIAGGFIESSGDRLTFQQGESAIYFNSDAVPREGISSSRYHGNNYTENSFVQKKYVDSKWSFNNSRMIVNEFNINIGYDDQDVSTTIDISPDRVTIASNDENGILEVNTTKGINSSTDYSSIAQDLDYVQKKYVDEKASQFVPYYIPIFGTAADNPLTGNIGISGNVSIKDETNKAKITFQGNNGILIDKTSSNNLSQSKINVNHNHLSIVQKGEDQSSSNLSMYGGATTLQVYDGSLGSKLIVFDSVTGITSNFLEDVSAKSEYNRVWVQNDSGNVGFVKLDLNNGIPLSGTESDKPLTAPIEFKNGITEHAMYSGNLGLDHSALKFGWDGEVRLTYSTGNVDNYSVSASSDQVGLEGRNADNSSYAKVSVSAGGIQLISDSEGYVNVMTGKGLKADSDYSQDAGDLDFIQKGYVDKLVDGEERIIDLIPYNIGGRMIIRIHNDFAFVKMEFNTTIDGLGQILIPIPETFMNERRMHVYSTSANIPRYVKIVTGIQGIYFINVSDDPLYLELHESFLFHAGIQPDIS